MIRRLRARHRAASVGLALFAPAILVAAIVARPEMPAGASPWPLPAPPAAGARTLRVDDVTLSYWIDASTASVPVLVLRADRSLEHPDVLVYATAERAERGAALPADAVLLGPFGGAARLPFLPLDPARVEGATRFLLFSLPHQEVLGSAPL